MVLVEGKSLSDSDSPQNRLFQNRVNAFVVPRSNLFYVPDALVVGIVDTDHNGVVGSTLMLFASSRRVTQWRRDNCFRGHTFIGPPGSSASNSVKTIAIGVDGNLVLLSADVSVRVHRSTALISRGTNRGIGHSLVIHWPVLLVKTFGI